MKPPEDELSLFAGPRRSSKGTSRGGRRTDKIEPYASALWLADYDSEAGMLRLTFGWAMKLDEQFLDHESGAWTLSVRVREGASCDTGLSGILSPVEETRGIVFHKASDLEEEINSQAERILADWLTFLTNRMLFNRCQTIDRDVPQNRVTDILLIYGPTLPKYVGRVCYSNFSQTKTVAILDPSSRIGKRPEESVHPWKAAPLQSFCHDCAQRRWVTDEDKTKARPTPRIGAFDLIEPTGDGFSGKILSESLLGPARWLAKAERVQRIIDHDTIEVHLANWRNRAVHLPRGLAHAARAAVLQQEIDRCASQLTKLEPQLSSRSVNALTAYRKQIEADVEGIELPHPIRDKHPLMRKGLLLRAESNYVKNLIAIESTEATARHTSPPSLSAIRNELLQSLGKSVFAHFGNETA
jgi:hypothetical protein